ncbi:MAG TPA: dihydroorotase [Phycisphaerales bacterium]|nr:dihydroorotase [Phycisphaerales bacterium]
MERRTPIEAASLSRNPGPLLITGGRVVDPVSGFDQVADIAIAGGVVVAIGPGLARGPADEVIDAQGCIVTPGLIDPHVHLREPGHEYKETIATGTAAAAAGGFTTVCCMPNTLPALDTPEILRFVQERSRSTGRARVYPVAAATKGRHGEELAEIGLLDAAGAVAFSDDGDCVPTPGMMQRVLVAVARTGKVFMQHCQEPTLTRGAAMHAGSVSVRLGLGGWPRIAEELIIERDVMLNRSVGCRYHVQHLSSAGSVEIVRRARAAGKPVTAEASPHHLLLTHTACDGYNTLAKVNPPIREQSDVDAVRAGVADGTITVLATDHAPHSHDEKSLPFEEAPMGMVGLETALGLYREALVDSGAITWRRLIELLTIEPARLCGLDALGLGRLAVGGPADVTVIDTELEWTIDPSAFVGRSRNTPFAGRKVRGKAVATVVGGEVTHTLARSQAR